MCFKMVIYKDHIKMHGQRNIKFYLRPSRISYHLLHIFHPVVINFDREDMHIN